MKDTTATPKQRNDKPATDIPIFSVALPELGNSISRNSEPVSPFDDQPKYLYGLSADTRQDFDTSSTSR